MKISVVICTHNRADMLADSLASWAKLEQPAANSDTQVELLVVDNASTDSTADVVRACGTATYFYEATPGLSHARNSGIRQATGDLIAFVDDDVYFNSSWLLEVLAAFEAHPEIHCLGGQSIPYFETEAPEWFGADAAKFYGSTGSGSECRMMKYPEHPFGVNMVFRREIFERVGGFDPKLGRIGQSLLSNEEKDFFYRAEQNDCVVLYWPEAIIHHRIPEERVSKAWLLDRSYWQGISDVVFESIVRSPPRISLFKESFVSLLAALKAQKRALKSKYVSSDPRRQLVHELQRERQVGIFRQSLADAIVGRSHAKQ